MTYAGRGLRSVATLAVGLGFALASLGRAYGAIRDLVRPEVGWRTVHLGGVVVRLPPDWGDPERDGAGELVIHNRPARFRTDGDAVWYASAIELRIRAQDALPRSAEAMSTSRRRLLTPSGTTVLELAIANGVGPCQRRIATRILSRARAVDVLTSANPSRTIRHRRRQT
jgi:hypothetical protein